MSTKAKKEISKAAKKEIPSKKGQKPTFKASSNKLADMDSDDFDDDMDDEDDDLTEDYEEQSSKEGSSKEGSKDKSSAKSAKKGKSSKEIDDPVLAERLAAEQGNNEDEDEDEDMGSSDSSSSSQPPANFTSEMSASFKNFRHHPDMENFYRFIFENDLRHEALDILDQLLISRGSTIPMRGEQKSTTKKPAASLTKKAGKSGKNAH